MGMGIALAGLSGAGQAVGEELQSQDRFDQEQQLMQQKSDLDEQKTMRLMQASADQADAQRSQAVARIGAAAQTYLNQATVQNAMADPDFAKTANGPVDINSLSSDQLAKYAPTSMQQASAWVQGARDTGDLPIMGLLQSMLADRAQQNANSMLDRQLASAESIASANRDASQKTAEASINAQRNGQLLQAALSTLAPQEQDLQATKNAFFQTYQRFIGIAPKLPNGGVNPDYDPLLQVLKGAREDYNGKMAQVNAARQDLAQRMGLPQSAFAPHEAIGGTIYNHAGQVISLVNDPQPAPTRKTDPWSNLLSLPQINLGPLPGTGGASSAQAN